MNQSQLKHVTVMFFCQVNANFQRCIASNSLHMTKEKGFQLDRKDNRSEGP